MIFSLPGTEFQACFSQGNTHALLVADIWDTYAKAPLYQNMIINLTEKSAYMFALRCVDVREFLYEYGWH